MSDFPNIVNTKIISTEWDVFWQDNHIPEMGGNIAVLVLAAPYAAGSAEHIALQKMLQACGLAEGEYHIMQVQEGVQLPWHRLRDAVQPAHILLLGVMPQQLGISAMFQLFSPNRFDDRIWIAGPSLTQLEQQPEGKKQLWLNGLKPVFVDKTVK